MLKEERQSRILEMLHANGKVVAAELSLALDVSEDTIRRDLRDLSDQGRIRRVHGGGLPHSPAEVRYQERLNLSTREKKEIGVAAAGHIQPGSVVFLDGGTTTLQVAQSLPQNLNSTFVTNSPSIAIALSVYPLLEVILIGGKFNKDQQVVVGASAESALRSIRPDLCLLGICSLHPETGITVPDPEEASFKRCLIAQSEKIIALASTEKLNTASTFRVADLTVLDTLITNRIDDPILLNPYKELGIAIEEV